MRKDNPTKDTIYRAIIALAGLLFAATVAMFVGIKMSLLSYGLTSISSLLAISNIFQMLQVLSHKNRHNKKLDEKNHYDYYKRITVFAAITLPISLIIILCTILFMTHK